MRLLIVTRAPERFLRWAPPLERHGYRVLTAPPEAAALAHLVRSGAPDAALVDLTDPDAAPARFRGWLARFCPGAGTALIGIAPPERLASLLTEPLDDALPVTAAAEEVLFRVRRAVESARRRPPVIELGELVLRPEEGLAILQGRRVLLRSRELELLCFLAQHPNRVFRREELAREVWGARLRGSLRTVDTHICRLRERLGSFGARHIETVRGVGYRFTTPPGAAGAG